MPLYTPDDPQFDAIVARHAWFEHVLAAACGELLGDPEPPEALDWTTQLPEALLWDFESVDCSLAFCDKEYAASVWDVVGEDDLPWATFLVDDAGARLLPECSVLSREGDLDAVLEKAMHTLPARLLAGEFTRTLPPVQIPEWLKNPVYKPEDA